MRFAIPSAALILSICLCPGARGVGQAAKREGPRYADLVADYRHQDVDAVRIVLTLTEVEVTSAVAAATEASTAWTSDDLRAAAMLHTDACTALLTAARPAPAFVHLNAAIRLISLASILDARSRRFASIWYANVAHILTQAGAPAWAEQVNERARTVVPVSEAEAHFQGGLDFEIAACERNPGARPDSFGMRASVSLRAATSRFETALRIDPSLHVAALHLGRVRLLQGSLDEARQNFDVATRSTLASERYLALLYLGAIAEQKVNIEEAEARMRAAAVEFKWGQSAPMALARLLSRTNREAESRDAIRALLRHGANTIDPLWTYLARPGRESAGILKLLRTEIWQ
jgi:hypothetical protein